jgi:hypothetical protein
MNQVMINAAELDAMINEINDLKAQIKKLEVRNWVGLTTADFRGYSPEVKVILENIEAVLKRRNT